MWYNVSVFRLYEKKDAFAMNLKLSSLCVAVFAISLVVRAKSYPEMASLKDAVSAFASGSPEIRERAYSYVESIAKKTAKPSYLRDALSTLRNMASVGENIESFERFCIDGIISSSNEARRIECLNAFVRSPKVDGSPMEYIQRIESISSKMKNPAPRFRLEVAKVKADIFAMKIKDLERGIKVLDDFKYEAGTNTVLKSSAMAKQMEIYHKSKSEAACEAVAMDLYGMELCPDTEFTASALMLSELHAKRGDMKKAVGFLLTVLERSKSVPVGIAGRFTKMKAEKVDVEKAVKMIRDRVASLPVRDTKTFRAAVERWQPELITLLTYLEKGEEALAECRVLIFFSSAQKYQKAVALTAKTFKIVDGNLGRAASFMNFQKKGMVPKCRNVMMEPERLRDEVRKSELERLFGLQDDIWEDLLVRSQRLLWLDDPYGSVRCAMKAFSLAPFEKKALQSCADAIMKPILAVTRDPSVGKAIVDYMLYGERGKDGVSGSKDDVSDPLQTWGGLLRTAAGAR